MIRSDLLHKPGQLRHPRLLPKNSLLGRCPLQGDSPVGTPPGSNPHRFSPINQRISRNHQQIKVGQAIRRHFATSPRSDFRSANRSRRLPGVRLEIEGEADYEWIKAENPGRLSLGGVHKLWQCPTLAQPKDALPLGLQRFTSVFGMGTGGATALWSPEGW